MEKKKLTDIVCASVVAGAVLIVSCANLFQPDRPTVSESEKRTLAQMPTLTADSLTSGEYTSGVSEFISDTFIGREHLVSLSKKIDSLTGIDYKLGGADNFVVIGGTTSDEGVEEADSSDTDLLSQAFENLNNRTDEDTTAPETSTEEADDTESTQVAVTEAEIEDEEPEAQETDAQAEEESSSETETSPEETTEQTSESEPETTETQQTEAEPAETGTPSESESSESTASESETPAPAEASDTQETTTTEESADSSVTESEPVYTVKSLTLSKSSLTLTVGAGSVVTASLDTDNPHPGSVKWSISDKTVAHISLNSSGGVDVVGASEGTCTLTCRYGDDFRATCEIKVENITSVTQTQNDEQADFLTNGLFIYGDAVYTPAYWSQANAEYYAQTVLYYKQLFGSDTRVDVIVAPVSSVVIDNPTVTSKISDQKDILSKLGNLMDASINYVDTYTNIYSHRDEYLFFKSDHHWTARGAYYAYAAFAESIGLTPTPLEDFGFEIRNDSYQGSMYMYTQDARVATFRDTIEVFNPTKSHTMTVTSSTGAVYSYDTCIVKTNTTYVTFIGGDNPYTVINVPSNPQDFSCLVLKDSFGNAFVPYLCEHYGNIIVVDVRYSDFNIYNQLKDYGIDDVIFVNNIQAALTTSWPKMYLSAVGVN